MPNIIGEGFRDFVVDQITRRERQYGLATRTNQNIAYQNSKTGWVCMASGVNVADVNFFKGSSYQGLNVGDNTLAKQYVLFNGTYNSFNQQTTTNADKIRTGINRANQKEGINRDGSILNEGAYGLGGLEFGLRPMPGISSVSITSGPRGSLRFAEVKIKAWNRAQFEALDALYMRIGYTVLIEFGHSNFYYNNGTYEENNPWTLTDSFLDGVNNLGSIKNEADTVEVVRAGKALGQYDVLAMIRHLREKSNGNYDALYGKVVNFNWSYQKDGSYDITVKVVSMGDVIEALKLNTMSTPRSLASGSTAQEGEAQAIENPTSAQLIESYSSKHDIGKMLNEVRLSIDQNGTDSPGYIRYVKYGVSKDSTGRTLVDAFRLGVIGSFPRYYIRLGSFLQWYQVAKMIVVRDDQPLLSIDYDTDSNLVYFAEGQRSTDPTICILSLEYPLIDGTKRVYAPGMEKYAENIKQGYGKIMNTYMNFEYLLTTLDAVQDSEGNVVLVDFLEKILSGICEATGNVNKLSVAIDEEENIIRIIDEVKLPGRDELIAKLNKGKAPKLALFTMYGFRTEGNGSGANRGSFIKDFNIQTGFSKETAAMIAIGAQANAQVVGEDATAFSAWSRGLVDRIEPSKLDKAVSPATGSYDETFKTDLANYNKYLSEISNGNGTGAPTFNTNQISTWASFQRTYLQYKIGENARSKDVASNTIGFLPINLSLTMEGLSGMKVYQKFAVDSAFLPANYPTALEFIVKSIAHSIEGNQWTTTIESLVVPNSIPKTGEMGYLREVPSANGAQTGTGGGAAPPPTNQEQIIGTVPARGNDSQAAVNAIIAAANHVFGVPLSPETRSRCARYTYNLAKSYVEALANNITKSRGASEPAGGNANDASYRAALTKLGYSGTKIGNFKGSDLDAELRKSQFNIGDVIIYYRGSEKFHTQIYHKGYISKGSNWACDQKNNFGANFVYRRTHSNAIFEFWVFKAPSSVPQTTATNPQTVPKTTSGLTAAQAAQKIKEFGEDTLIKTNKPKVQLTVSQLDTENWPDYRVGSIFQTYQTKGAIARVDLEGGDLTSTIKPLGNDYVQFPLDVSGDTDAIVVKIKVTDIDTITKE